MIGSKRSLIGFIILSLAPPALTTTMLDRATVSKNLQQDIQTSGCKSAIAFDFSKAWEGDNLLDNDHPLWRATDSVFYMACQENALEVANKLKRVSFITPKTGELGAVINGSNLIITLPLPEAVPINGFWTNEDKIVLVIKKALRDGLGLRLLTEEDKSDITQKFQTYIPSGWNLLRFSLGDLDKDGKDDAALILEKNDPKNRKKNTLMGPPYLNLNPRRLLVLLQSTEGYKTVLSSDRVIPAENDEGEPCLDDPLGWIQISKGVLKIGLGSFSGCGSWETNNDEYLFRYENARFRLIGRDRKEFMRSSGEEWRYSFNYLTNKTKITEGLNVLKDTKPKIIWKKIKTSKPKYLDEISSSELRELDVSY